MIVTCKVCNTRYRLDPERIKDKQAKVRCSNCGEVFTVNKPPEGEVKEQLLTDIFHDEALEEEEEIVGGMEKKGLRASGRGRPWLRWSMVGIAIVVVVCVIYLYRGFFNTESVQPEKTAPPQTASKEDPGIKKITIADAEGNFKVNKEAGEIFVIRGAAQNKNNQPFSFIRLRGLLHNANAQKVKEEEVFAGNIFTDEELSALPMSKIRECSQNKYGKDNSNYNVPPGKAIPFIIVFTQIPDNLAEFTVRVVGGQTEPSALQ